MNIHFLALRAIGLLLALIFPLLYSQPIFESSDLTNGMILNSRTRMSRNEMIGFDLIVISVQKNGDPGEDTILAEITNRLFYETGVLAGMSGSPVYKNNKLVGAIAYTSSFMKKPIVGITPIRAMLRAYEYSKKTNNFDSNPYPGGKKFYGLTPISIPLAVSGKSVLSESEWVEAMGSPHTVISSGISAKSGISKNVSDTPMGNPFQPGDAVAINLVRGDIYLSAIGTVTWVSNDHLLAFGHPMQLSGRCNYPLYTASIDTVIPLQTLSYKVGTLGEEVGAIVEDRTPAILGKIGKAPERIVVNVALNSHLQSRKFHYEVLNSPEFFNQLTPYLILNSFRHYESTGEEGTLLYKVIIETDYKNKKIEFSELIPTLERSASLAGNLSRLSSILAYISSNPLVDIKITKIDATISSIQKIEHLSVIDAWTERPVYLPGSEVKLTIEYSGYKAGEASTNLIFRLPPTLSDGIYNLIVSDGYTYLAYDNYLSPAKSAIYAPEKIFEILNEEIGGQSLVLWMADTTTSVQIGGEDYRGLPLTKKEYLIGSRTKKKGEGVNFNKKVYTFPQSISGIIVVPIKIKKESSELRSFK